MKGSGGAGSTFAIAESSSGAASAAATKPASVSGVAGSDEHAADHGVDGMEPELEARRDAEVAAPAADRPEESGSVLRVDAPRAPVGGDDLGGEQAVDRQSVLADEIADPSAEREPADADGRVSPNRIVRP